MNGTLKCPPRRNPILGEKSSRPGYNDWDFNPPEAQKPVDKWNYPEEPYPLIAKFDTQKQRFLDEEIKKEKYREVMKMEGTQRSSRLDSSRTGRSDVPLAQDNDLKQQLDSSRTEGTGRLLSERANRDTARITTRDVTGREYNYGASTLEPIPEKTNNNEKSISKSNPKSFTINPNSRLATLATNNKFNFTATSEEKKNIRSLTDLHASQVKLVAKDHPEIVEKYRATRALDYINRTQQLQEQAAKKGTKSDGALLTDRLNTLESELKRTESMIERQKLKIGLSKGKGGNSNSSVTVSASARRALAAI